MTKKERTKLKKVIDRLYKEIQKINPDIKGFGVLEGTFCDIVELYYSCDLDPAISKYWKERNNERKEKEKNNE